MVVLTTPPPLEEIPLIRNFSRIGGAAGGGAPFPDIPVVDLSAPGAGKAIVRACEELGFFKATNHGMPAGVLEWLESEAVRFFSLPEEDKGRWGPASPFGYGQRRIGRCGDAGWIEYLLLPIHSNSIPQSSLLPLGEHISSQLLSALQEYIKNVQKVGKQVLELMAEGLGVAQRGVFSELVMGEESEQMVRLNYYPRCSPSQVQLGNPTGFGEHTDPQVISLLRSNSTTGLQIALKDGSWVPVPPDPSAFYVNVGDALQVLTNGRFRSVKHRVLANGEASRVSMIYFGGPALQQRIAPVPQLMAQGEQSLYKEFTWGEYKTAAYNSRLADHRLGLFERKIDQENNNNAVIAAV